jgi:tetratricopeptide (TPR) repeat protein
MNRRQRRAQAKLASAPPVAAPGLEGMFGEALRLHQAGRLGEAERLYRHVLAVDPRQADAVHLRGLIAQRVGDAAAAARLFGQAIRLNDSVAAYYGNLGIALFALKRLDDAIDAYANALRLKPDWADSACNLGLAYYEAKRFDEAIAAQDAAIRLKPDLAEGHFNRGLALSESGRRPDAMIAYRRAICVKPDYAEAYCNFAHVVRDQGRRPEAIAAVYRALRLRPMFAEAHYNLGNIWSDLNRYGDAVAAYRAALCIRPDFAEVCCNLGIALQNQRQLDKAVAAYNAAIRIKPGFAEAYYNLGNGLKDWGRLDDAIAANQAAIRFRPDFPKAHFNDSLACLVRGDFAVGWRKFELRWRGGTSELRQRSFAQPRWEGENIFGKTILLHAEQGAGDTVQFCRYVPMVAARGGRVVLEAQRPLLPLLACLPGVERLIAAGDPLPDFDMECPLMSLPGVFGADLGNIPSEVPYLRVDEAMVGRWGERLGHGNGVRRVGLVWAGRPEHSNDHNRSLPPAALNPLWSVPGIRWYSLQMGERRADLAAFPPGLVEDLSPHLADFAETAAALSRLDLLVTADTAVAHVAGALGRPAWVMVPVVPDWRWLLNREDSPWYPTLRLFRQTAYADWADVVRRVAASLTDFPSPPR